MTLLDAGKTSLYDGAGNLMGQLDRRGTLTEYRFDALNRATVTVDGNGQRATTLHDAAGNVTGM